MILLWTQDPNRLLEVGIIIPFYRKVPNVTRILRVIVIAHGTQYWGSVAFWAGYHLADI